ncbi:MAG: putative ABC transporter permease [Bacilli bacterium]|nr:putative ABC transporter permease [Bacilli bacterium]
MNKEYKNYINKNHTFDKKTMFGIFCLVTVIAGIFGFVYEFIFYYFNSGMQTFYWRGGNFLPWINIYAIGSIMIYFLTYKHRKNPWKVFLIALITCGILEYIAGLGMYIIGDGFRCWDYNTEILSFGNIHGFVCLRSVLFFGLSGLLLMYVIIPFCFYLAKKINKKLFLTLGIILCSIILLDEIYNLLIARIFSLPRASDIYSSIGFNYMKFK